MSSTKYIYDFSEGSADMRLLLGGKGANLAQMWKIGLPVPPGFIITTEACHQYWKENDFIAGIWSDVEAAIGRVEKLTGKNFGSSENPLLVSVRSGAPVSMPGMMDTILNLGLNDDTVKALAKSSGNERFAYDSYRRFIQMFSDVVLGVDLDKFEKRLEQARDAAGVKEDYKIPAEELKKLVEDYKQIVADAGHTFPTDPWKQLRLAIDAVFRSWNTPRAITYRKINNIPEDYGTAVNVVTMVFGNLGDDCGTGVCFTRSPSTGENKLFGEYLINAQGEDVVAGIRTPMPIASLGETMPEVYKQFCDIAKLLENHYRDAQDIEFTVEKGKLYILQTRNGKRTAAAAVRIAMDMLHEGLIDAETAVSRVAPEQVEQLLHPQLDPKAKRNVLVKGLPASPGAAVGKVVFHPRPSRDHPGRHPRTLRGPGRPHEPRRNDEPCGSRRPRTRQALRLRSRNRKDRPRRRNLHRRRRDRQERRIPHPRRKQRRRHSRQDGTHRPAVRRQLPRAPRRRRQDREAPGLGQRRHAGRRPPRPRLRSEGHRPLPHRAHVHGRRPSARHAGDGSRLDEGRENRTARQTPGHAGIRLLRNLRGHGRAARHLPVTIRLLDPPLHEFLPKIPELTKALETLDPNSAEAQKIQATIARARELHEQNPMLGFRGCRLGMIYPEIYEMQVRAIFDAACKLTKKGVKVIPDIMIPLVGTKFEMKAMRDLVDEVAKQKLAEHGVELEYMVGTMIELPRAAMVADQLAEYAQFFSCGTNDLTQTTFGYSRDDAEGKFLGQYVEMGVFEQNPFAQLDRDGVGGLMTIAAEKGRKTRPGIQIGICGEHGGNPSSIAFCNSLNFNYVSCSPFRVPVARLSAALAAMGVIK